MASNSNKRIISSIVFAVVVLIVMMIVDYFVLGTDKQLYEHGKFAAIAGKKFIDLVFGFLIGYFLLFKEKKTEY